MVNYPKRQHFIDDVIRGKKGCNRAIPRISATQKLVFFKGKSIAYEVCIEMALDWE
jgi:hypothetical protein